MQRLLIGLLLLASLCADPAQAAFRASSTNATQSTSLVVTKPTGTASGDCLIAWATNDTSIDTFTWPSGFTEVANVSVASDGMAVGAAIKIAGGSEPANYTLAATSAVIGGVIAFSSCDATQPHRYSTQADATPDASPWSLDSAAFASATTETCDIVFIGGSDTSGTPGAAVVHTAPSGYTIPASGDISSLPYRHSFIAYKESVAAGATGSLSATGTLSTISSADGVIVIALKVTGGSTPETFGFRLRLRQ